MTENVNVITETPNTSKKIRIKLPSRQTLKKVATLTGVAALGGVVGYRAAKRGDDCACESGTDETTGTTDN